MVHHKKLKLQHKSLGMSEVCQDHTLPWNHQNDQITVEWSQQSPKENKCTTHNFTLIIVAAVQEDGVIAWISFSQKSLHFFMKLVGLQMNSWEAKQTHTWHYIQAQHRVSHQLVQEHSYGCRAAIKADILHLIMIIKAMILVNQLQVSLTLLIISVGLQCQYK